MNSSRARYNHIRPSNPMDIMTASTQAGMASMRAKMNQIQEEERIAQGQCTYCRKEAGNALKSCARCKAARYCNQTCQLADFKARHKRECTQFASPPITTAFLTKPVANERFPQQPAFAHGHEDGVGCWVSIKGRLECDLEKLTEPLESQSLSDSNARKSRMESGPDGGRGKIRAHKATAHSLLRLSVLVQNRRKDKAPIVVFGSHVQVVSSPSSTAAVLRGSAQGDNLTPFVRGRAPYVAAGVVNDPWDMTPRLEIAHLNGQEVKQPLPANIKDATQGIVTLEQGEYVIFYLQFRIGDGDAVAKDWEAIECLETIHIPYALWDGTSSPAALASSLPLVQSRSQPGESTDSCKSLRASFDQFSVRAHYADFIEHGEEAYMRSHFGGDSKEQPFSRAINLIDSMAILLREHSKDEGELGEKARLLRQLGPWKELAPDLPS